MQIVKSTYPPGPKGGTFLGNLRAFQSSRLEFLERCLGYGDVVYFRLLNRPAYLLNNPEHIHQVLVGQPQSFHKSPMFKKNTRQVIGNGLLTSDGEFHKRQRKLVQPAFHSNRIASYAEVMVDRTERMLDTWQDHDERNIAEEMMALTMSIVAKTLFDTEVADEASAIGHAITVGIKTVGERLTKPLYLPDWIPTAKNTERRKANALLEETIQSFIAERRKSGEDRGDLLSMLLLAQDEDGSQMSDKQVRDEAMTLFIAGHETTANALSWTLYLLSQNPDAAARLRAELDAVLADRVPTIEDLPSLSYTEMVVKEALRLYPPAWIISRIAIEDVVIGGWDLRAGSIIVMSPWVTHRNPRYWKDPEHFDPERFTPENEKLIPRFAYFPFGGGPRICIGNQFAMMEAVLALATIARRFDVALLEGQQIKPEPLVTLRPRDGIRMRLIQRQPELV